MLWTDLTRYWPPTMCNANVRGGGRHLFFTLLTLVLSTVLFISEINRRTIQIILQSKGTSEYSLGDFREEKPYPGSPLRLWVEFHPYFPVVSSNIALLPIPSKFGVYDVKRLNKSCGEFGGLQFNVYYTTLIWVLKFHRWRWLHRRSVHAWALSPQKWL